MPWSNSMYLPTPSQQCVCLSFPIHPSSGIRNNLNRTVVPQFNHRQVLDVSNLKVLQIQRFQPRLNDRDLPGGLQP